MRAFRPGDEHACERILRSLPDWFGIEESLRQYVEDSKRYPTTLAADGDDPVGFLTLHQHFPESAEIHCIAVLPEHHRRGVGRLLVDHAESQLRERGVRFLQVKTMGPSRPCEFYAKSIAFYRGIGFAPLEEIHGLWGRIPCLVLVKKL
jgi:ribosomal protein S18 acetylase RimI-like enzyme